MDSRFELVLPQELGDALFLDFLADGGARLLKPRRDAAWKYFLGFSNPLVDYLPGRLGRLRFNATRTLQPFLSKLDTEDRRGDIGKRSEK